MDINYVPQHFVDGQTLEAKHLNHIEEGIKQNENSIKSKAELVDGKIPESQIPENIRGEKGEPGEKGKDGKTAYEYAQEGGYTGTEEEFSEKLASEPLIGITAEITPTQVAEALSKGREIALTHVDTEYGMCCCNNFSYAVDFNAILSSAIVQYIGSYMLIALYGNMTTNSWTSFATKVATLNDVPTDEHINNMIDEKVKSGENFNYIIGDSTTDGVWTGTCENITEYYEGLTILYKTNVVGVSSGTTLNINNLGAVSVKRNATTNITTTYPIGSVIMFTYSDGNWLTADYDVNTKNTAGTSNKSDTKLFLAGATSQSSSATTYSNKNVYVDSDNCLYSNGKKVATSTDVAAVDEKVGDSPVSDQIVAAIEAIEPFKPSVKEYGAVGDGSTDDREAFQTALAENRLVYVPEGTYVLSDTITIGANSELELAQSAVLIFTQTSGNCISMLRLANLNGNHATIFVPYTFNGNVINCDGGNDYALLDKSNLTSSNATAVPPFKKWDPQWKMSRYVTDINICKPNEEGFNYSNDGTCYGNGIYIHCDEADWPANYMWGVSMSGVRIAGGFVHGIQINNNGKHVNSWNHDMRIEAVIDACKIGVSVKNAYYNRLAITFQPRPAADGTAYSEQGIKITDSKGIDLSSSRIWDWMTKDEETGKSINSKWEPDNEYQHIALYGDCSGLILDDFIYYAQSTYDIRELIYTNTPSNLEKMTILQEPITRWFKPINNEPYFSDGYSEKKLVTQAEMDALFGTTMVAKFTNLLPSATDTDGTIYNGIGYKVGVLIEGYMPPEIETAPYSVLTGFIPVKDGSTIRFKDLWWDKKYGEYERIVFFDKDKNPIENGKYTLFIDSTQIATSQMLVISDFQTSEEGFLLTLGTNVKLNDVGYVRMTFFKNNLGANPIITVDEEIVYEQVGILNEDIKIKAESVIGLPNGNGVTLESPNGTLYKIVVNDDGTLSTIVQ